MPVAARSIANLQQGGGRAGRPGKIPATIKEMVERALSKAGGVDYLVEQAHANPVAFMGLIGRVLPLQVTGENGGALLIDFRWADASVVATDTKQVADETATATIESSDVVDVTWSDISEC